MLFLYYGEQAKDLSRDWSTDLNIIERVKSSTFFNNVHWHFHRHCYCFAWVYFVSFLLLFFMLYRFLFYVISAKYLYLNTYNWVTLVNICRWPSEHQRDMSTSARHPSRCHHWQVLLAIWAGFRFLVSQWFCSDDIQADQSGLTTRNWGVPY